MQPSRGINCPYCGRKLRVLSGVPVVNGQRRLKSCPRKRCPHVVANGWRYTVRSHEMVTEVLSKAEVARRRDKRLNVSCDEQPLGGLFAGIE